MKGNYTLEVVYLQKIKLLMSYALGFIENYNIDLSGNNIVFFSSMNSKSEK